MYIKKYIFFSLYTCEIRKDVLERVLMQLIHLFLIYQDTKLRLKLRLEELKILTTTIC